MLIQKLSKVLYDNKSVAGRGADAIFFVATLHYGEDVKMYFLFFFYSYTTYSQEDANYCWTIIPEKTPFLVKRKKIKDKAC